MRSLHIAFVHPFLGLGGAERLVVDAAALLQHAGYSVTILTTRHDPARSFLAGNGKIDLEVHGDFLPAELFGCLRAPCTLARMTALAAAAARGRARFDVVVCDLVAHVVPLIRAGLRAPVLFYCHYPDLLLAAKRRSWYRTYRWPIDALEAAGLRRADRVLVNSRFTQRVFARVFSSCGKTPEVLYPGIDCAAFENVHPVRSEGPITLLSIARFDSKKNLALAVQTLAQLRSRIAPELYRQVRLLMAGGYDAAFAHGPDELRDLRRLAAHYGVAEQVEFVPNADAARIARLLEECRCVLYPPRGEHLGIVPLEAMAAARPVIAVNEGGPLETVLDGRTGFLREPTPAAFAEAAAHCIQDPALATQLGARGREHVRANFSHQRFARGFENALLETVRGAAA
jgi:alpha-1,3/alpha-1,6-mannosyltransferase